MVDVPLGEDDFGTATLTWSSAIRLFKPDDDGGVGVTTFSPVGTLESGPYGSYYTLTWDVTQEPQSQMFYAQGVAGSLNLGDQSFNLSAALFLYDPATDPPVNQQTTPATSRLVTQPWILLRVKAGNDPAQTQPVGGKAVMDGEHIIASIDDYGPVGVFPADPIFSWQVSGKTVEEYRPSETKTIIRYLPATPVGALVDFYYTEGSFSGMKESISVMTTLTDGTVMHFRPYITVIYKPAADITGYPSGNPESQVGFFRPKSGEWLHLGDTLDLRNPNEKFPPGYIFKGSVTDPSVAGLDSSGTINLVQIVNVYRKWSYGDEAFSPFAQYNTLGYVLDHTFPYSEGFSLDINSTSPLQLSDSTLGFNDSPGMRAYLYSANDPEFSQLSDSDVGTLINDFHAQDSIIYKYGGTNGPSIYVTLQNGGWNWSVTTSNNSNDPLAWSQPTGTEPIKQKLVESDTLPTWSANAKDFHIRIINTVA